MPLRLQPETLDQVRNNDYNAFLAKLDHRLEQGLSCGPLLLPGLEALTLPRRRRPGLPRLQRGAEQPDPDHTAVFNANVIFSPRLINETKVQLAQRSYKFTPVVAEPTLEITNLLLMGKTTSDLDFYKETRWQG